MLLVHCNVHFIGHFNAHSWYVLQLYALLFYVSALWQIMVYAMYCLCTLSTHGIHSPSNLDVTMCFECMCNPVLRMCGPINAL
jgi:hypothetical protein